MANKQSALKEIRKSARRRSRNRLVRARTRTLNRRAVQAIADGDQDAVVQAQAAMRELDKAASKGIIHKNAASRSKSRLAKKLRGKTNSG